MNEKILIVDDSFTIRSVLQVYLMDLHLEFIEAEGGERALHLLNLMPFDLVIADVKMAPMDGLTFLKKVRESSKPEVQKIPVLMLTGEKSPEVRKQGVLFGADDFLLKPINQDQLLETVKRLLEKRKKA
jgi:two-component system chemotaxis response regulator CheY